LVLFICIYYIMERFDRILIIFWILSLIVWLIGSIAPILPWPALSLIWLLLIQRTTRYQFSRDWIIIFGVLVVVSMVIDYYLPIWGTKKYGGTQAWVIWSTLGMVSGIFLFPPLGMIVLPFVGAFLWEYLIAKSTGEKALRSARGSFVGFLIGTGYKLILCGWMIVWATQQIW